MARGEGLRVRFARIPGETMKGVLARPLILPAALGTVGWTEEASHSEYDTVRSGQFSQPSMGPTTARMLRELDDIETLTVEWDPSWLVEQGQDPEDVYDKLFAVLRSRTPVELLMTLQFGPARPLLRMNVTIRSISPQLREGQPDTVYYTVRVKEWRNAKTGRRGQGRGDKLPTTYTLKKGDDASLHSLARRYYHSVLYARDIARANGIRDFGISTPLLKHRKLKPGSKLKIPKVSKPTNAVSKPGQPKIGALNTKTGKTRELL